MWWGKSQDKPAEAAKAPEKAPELQPSSKDVKTARPDVEFDPAKLPQREKLPARLQKIIEKSDKEENVFDEVVEG